MREGKVSSSSIDSEVRTWRMSLGLRIFGTAFTAILTIPIAIGFILLFKDAVPAGIIIMVAFGLLGFWMWYVVWRPRTQAGPHGISLRRGWRTTQVTWSEISRCTAGYSGITITRLDGSYVIAPVPQKSNLSRWLRRTSEADEVAAYLQQRARRYRKRAKAATSHQA
jgi:hypothetical protein